MALEKALVLSSNLFRAPKSPLANSYFNSSYRSSNLPTSYSFLFFCSTLNIKRFGFDRRYRCSVDYNDHHEPMARPKPSEIPWRKDLCNSVHLIGNVGAPVQIKHLSSGKVVAWSRLAVKKSSTDTIWINLTFWDELAHVAYQHVDKGQQIYVSGRLVSDTVDTDEGKQQIYYKVVVQQLNFVEKSSSSMSSFDRGLNYMASSTKLANPNGAVSTEQLWQAFFANPVDWWDNRKNKRSPKYPDFKHKDTGEALWIEGRYNPPWVKSQLAILDSRMGHHHDQENGMHVNFMSRDRKSVV